MIETFTILAHRSTLRDGFDDVTVLRCGASETHIGTSMASGGSHITRVSQYLNAM